MKIKPKPSQSKFTVQILQKDVLEGLYAGTAGTGKTFWVAILIIGLCHDFPGSRFGVFRKELSTARKTVWNTYIKALEMLEIPYRPVKGMEPAIYFDTYDSRIEFFGLDRSKDPDYMKTKGLELSGAHLDEANEVEVEAKNIVKSRIGRWNENGVPAKMIYTCNPSQGWVREEFREPAEKGDLPSDKIFVQSDASELEDAYRAILESLPETEKERYLMNNWNYSDDPAQLIKYEWIRQALIPSENRADELGVDFSRTKDKSILAGCIRGEVSRISFFEDVMQAPAQTIATAEHVINRINELHVPAGLVSGDVVGVGAGAIDYMKTRGYPVHEYNGALPAIVHKVPTIINGESRMTESALQFKNKRAQDYWTFREALRTGILKVCDDDGVIRELVAIRYKVDNKVIQIEEKAEIIKRLGHSPDKADAAVMAYAEKKPKKTFGFVI